MHNTKRYTVLEALGATASNEVALIIERADKRASKERLPADAAIRKALALVLLMPDSVANLVIDIGPKSVRWMKNRWWLYSHPHGIAAPGAFGRTIEVIPARLAQLEELH